MFLHIQRKHNRSFTFSEYRDAVGDRGYTERKVQENMECEIMMVLQEEAKESYR